MIRNANIFIFLLLLAGLFSCSQQPEAPSVTDVEPADSVLDVSFIRDGKLVVLMSNDISSYYIFKGQARGFEYEMLKLFCKENGLQLEVKVIRQFDHLLDSLLAGKGDLAAGNLTVTKARKAMVDFSPEVLRTRQVLIQRLPEGYKKLSKKQRQSRMTLDGLELDGKTVHLNAGSSFYDRIKNLSVENGLNITIAEVPGDVGTDQLVKWVADGKIDFTVADENVARIHAKAFKNIDIKVPLSLSQRISWAIPKGNDKLQQLLADWLNKRKGTTRYNIIYKKYFGQRNPFGNSKNYVAIEQGRISNYDDLLKKYASHIEWDWLLLAALVNKESHFNPQAHSSFGAQGLMQLLPTTAQQFGVERHLLHNPEMNIKAGTRYLQYLDKFWYERLQDTTQLQFFVLASYNAGPGHVLDAMRLAEKYDLDPSIWEDNVETMLLKKSQPKYYRDPVVRSGYCQGIQPVTYVERIMEYYKNYKTFNQSREIGSVYTGI